MHAPQPSALKGRATLVAGTVTIANLGVAAGTQVFVTRSAAGGTVGHLTVTCTPDTSITIDSSSNTDTSTVDWVIL